MTFCISCPWGFIGLGWDCCKDCDEKGRGQGNDREEEAEIETEVSDG